MQQNSNGKISKSVFSVRIFIIFVEYFFSFFSCLKRRINPTVLKRLLVAGALVYLYVCVHFAFHGYRGSRRTQKDKVLFVRTKSAQTNLKPYGRPIIPRHLRQNFTIDLPPVNTWIKTKMTLCNGNFVGYKNLFAHLRHVQINPSLSFGRKGGESIEKVIGQPEKQEYLTLRKGYFTMKCKGGQGLHYNFNKPKDHLKQWLAAVQTKIGNHGESLIVNRNFTIAVTRYEYVNLYHTMTDWFNAFLVLLVFKKNPNTASVLFVDGHPAGDLDSVWGTLFGNVSRAGHMTDAVMFDDLIWSINGYNSLLNQHSLPHVPYLEEFREFFLSRYNIPDDKKLDCQNLSILFIWRRDYVSHPRNPAGKIKRKIRNHMELQRAVQQVFPYHSVQGLQIDKLSMKEQLNLIAKTDILIGMHGAGLSFTLFLPQHASLIELFPRYLATKNNHFQAMAKWRNLHYLRWQNRDRQNEFPDFYTYIPIDIVVDKVNETVNRKCKEWMKS
ncbi:uncharacterized protein LOC111124162 [Crassostrea virginica]